MKRPVGEINKEKLEALIDACSLDNVLDMLATICVEKADHVRGNYQDDGLASDWERAAKLISRVPDVGV